MSKIKPLKSETIQEGEIVNKFFSPTSYRFYFIYLDNLDVAVWRD